MPIMQSVLSNMLPILAIVSFLSIPDFFLSPDEKRSIGTAIRDRRPVEAIDLFVIPAYLKFIGAKTFSIRSIAFSLLSSIFWIAILHFTYDAFGGEKMRKYFQLIYGQSGIILGSIASFYAATLVTDFIAVRKVAILLGKLKASGSVGILLVTLFLDFAVNLVVFLILFSVLHVFFEELFLLAYVASGGIHDWFWSAVVEQISILPEEAIKSIKATFSNMREQAHVGPFWLVNQRTIFGDGATELFYGYMPFTIYFASTFVASASLWVYTIAVVCIRWLTYIATGAIRNRVSIGLDSSPFRTIAVVVGLLYVVLKSIYDLIPGGIF